MWEGILQIGEILGIKRQIIIPTYQAFIQGLNNRGLIEPRTDEHEFLATITINIIPEFADHLAPALIIGPAILGHSRPPETHGLEAHHGARPT